MIKIDKDILIINKSSKTANNYSAFLSTQGYRISIPKTDNIIDECLEQNFYPIIIIDIELSQYDALIEYIKNNYTLSIVIVTGTNDSEISSAILSGAFEYVKTPINIELMIRKIHLCYIIFLISKLNIDVKDQIEQKIFKIINSIGIENVNNKNNKHLDIEVNANLVKIIKLLKESNLF